jgi:UDP:flavonoid glycosyltransferase YjiC (YdhE family)
MVILWDVADQPLWGAQVGRMNVGCARRLSTTTRESLVAQLRQVLEPRYVTQARRIAARMTKPAESVSAAADLLEDTARRTHAD